MLFPTLSAYNSLGLLTLRIITGIIFISSGWSHFQHPQERSKSIEMSVPFTFLLGLGEFAGGLFLVTGIVIQAASLLLIIIMAGAIYKKIVKWKIGFYGKDSQGWHYDLLILCANLVILFSGGGRYVIWP